MKDDHAFEKSGDRKRFFAYFTHHFATATVDHPTVRCWSLPSLKRALNAARSHLQETKQISSSFPRGNDLVTWLVEIGLAYRLPLVPAQAASPRAEFYVLELGAGPQSTVSAHELLQAADPEGVICFFSALVFHELTTQSAPFHHIAKLMEGPLPLRPEIRTPTLVSSSAEKDPRNRLGSLLFTYQDVLFFTTKRHAYLVTGVQTQLLNPQTLIRFTVLEQSLLDTLVNPEACGGQSVVFEAWERGWPKANWSTVRDILREAGLPLTRRFAALSKILQLPLAPELSRYLHECRVAADFRDAPPLQLLRGVSGQQIDSEWNVQLPI
ncbi:hypothetical protein [Oleiharenicola lentus]|uniref:hypothetical protein n=1 Tax=Oleiharenicola lentus TaxID=2508720 RepID=UPI003F671F98